ncbi:putative bifunctional diguanylate cyclase/phosphodiesterase [Pseudofrankia saprophytica]|uniref:putative bifunctional diguanylate cyclase/phosphodiesterase n=1 Tax=Pseudofrankia saprophytica TaxID=298655 RepID=UPI000913ACA2|nr:diguanylate cyclase [Pseudofrankia saprophytica]OHV29129.1 diguanylate cyclase [Pseudofrankia sp. EUN1h]
MVAGSAAAVVSLATVGCLAWTARRAQGADRRWRLLIELTLVPLVFALAWHISWQVEHGSAHATRLPRSAEAFLLIVALALAGVLTFPTDPLDAADRRVGEGRAGRRWYAITVLDSVVAVGSVVLVVWPTLLAPLVQARHLDSGALVNSVGSVVGFLLLVAGVLLLATFRRPRSGLALALLGAGLGAMMLYSAINLILTVQGSSSISPTMDVLAVASWLLILLACLVPVPSSAASVRRRDPRILWLQAALPYLALGVVGGLAIGELIADGAVGRVETYGLLGLLFVVVIRQMAMLGENTRLLVSVRASQQELHHQAFHDPLTGLANRALFADRMEQALAFRDGRPFALVFCDLDDFKRVNDTLGHDIGDELLRITAARLRSAVRSEDTVARLGGDEFALLVEGGHDDPETVGTRLAATIRAPCLLAGRSRPVGASLGLVMADPARHPVADSLLRDADLAMYAAKRQGKGGLVVYRPDLSTPESAPQIRAHLDQALRGDDPDSVLGVHYLPVVDLRSSRTVGLDAAPCWSRPRTGQFSSESLYRLADEAGLSLPLLDVVLRQTCRDLAARGARPADAPAFVTVPMNRDLEQTPVAGIVDLLVDHDLPPRAIILTLTGTCGQPDLTAAGPILRRLAARGVRLALDGVGGEASIFAAWQALPIEIIRLDRSLTRAGDASARERTALVRDAILAAAARLDLIVIATHLGEPAQARELAAAGCHLGTGPLYGPPHPMNEVPAAVDLGEAAGARTRDWRQPVGIGRGGGGPM